MMGHKDQTETITVPYVRDHRVDPLQMKWTVSLEGDVEVEL